MSIVEAYVGTSVSNATATAPSEAPSATHAASRFDAATALDEVRPAQWATTLTFVLADLVALFLITGTTYATVKPLLPAHDLFASHGSLLAAMPLFGLAYALSGLYRAAVMHPAEELRRVSIATTVVAVSSAASALVVGAPHSTTLVLAVVGILAMVVVPACRLTFRILFAQASWWGAPVIVLGTDAAGCMVVDTLQRWPELGLRPVALLQEKPQTNSYRGVAVLGGADHAPALATAHKIPFAIVAMPGIPHRRLATMLEQYGKFFNRIFVVPSISSAHTLWTTSQSYDGLLGYGVRHYSWYTGARFVKRGLDLLLTLLLLFMTAPLMLVIALLIKLDSPGPVFFTQERMGREGRIFNVLKFRTMFTDAETRLQEILRNDPHRREEYQLYHKLREDPRVTRIGKWLRQYSLDELPQLFNVLKNEMSLVGPRAYLPSELPSMNGLSRTVLQCPPGVTGLWQVSGRNELSFEERVDMDVHYMQNWSPWLDLYILMRTVPVVLSGEGAS